MTPHPSIRPLRRRRSTSECDRCTGHLGTHDRVLRHLPDPDRVRRRVRRCADRGIRAAQSTARRTTRRHVDRAGRRTGGRVPRGVRPRRGEGRSGCPGEVAMEGSLAVDGPSVFIWGLVIVLGFISILLFAERRLEGGLTAFAGQGAAIPGTEAEREDTAQRVEQTEVFPLALFAIDGMMVFASSNDLITMIIGLEVLSLPLYVLCGIA